MIAHINSKDTKVDDKPSNVECHTTYRNKLGEKIIFHQRYVRPGYAKPSGYEFVPTGNAFVTRKCRDLAQNLYVVYSPETRKKPATKIGIYVPEGTFDKVQSEFQAKRVKLEEDLLRALEKEYPNIPPVDKDKLHLSILEEYPHVTGISTLSPKVPSLARDYVRRQCTTPGKHSLILYNIGRSLGNTSISEPLQKINQKINEVLTDWRGGRLVENEPIMIKIDGTSGRKVKE
ncbi:hypothetical protein GMOD_00005646 [Pyrenophora seminiperda CCB06]|uniref:Uncharacterized protein n=1 Tax=Pyrenophora seminiperda CCB06 TaxID=1302712 RepID=A0A3M7M9E4_9PLEO|nr:hypothetical protein GMOD_00005646 [Pyrenophora seminiperda CCB06]